MVCQICTAYTDTAPAAKSNNCIIECIEKIKLHYVDMKKKIDDDALVMKSLNERNLELKEKLRNYERSVKKKPILFSQEGDGSGWCSDAVENEILNKTVDSLNVALNDEVDFETSCISDTPNSYKKQKVSKREPMKPISSANAPPRTTSKEDFTKIKQEPPECKKESSFLSKENKSSLRKDISRKNDRSFLDRPRLSLKSGFRQGRLQFGVKKITPISDPLPGRKPSLCDSFSDLDKSKDTSTRHDDSGDHDHTFEFASPFRKTAIPKEPSFPQGNESESSSVMMLTPETQDIIFLDDSCSSNIESMDLLRDFVKPPDNRLTNLKLFESNRIKLLQKTASAKAISVSTDNEHKGKDKSCNNSLLASLEETNLDESVSTDLEETRLSSSKQKASPAKDERLLRLNCVECEKYIKYLGHRLSDEEIEKHIRNCTKHKINEDIHCTPDGFWDPKIKPLDKDDPRVKVMVDTRFVRKKE